MKAYPVNGVGESLDRHPECLGDGCGLDPCGTYTCSMCSRTRPWCLGGDDELEQARGPLCDDCWCVLNDWAEFRITQEEADDRIEAHRAGVSP
ncbi:MAG TPA: hypothetical protein VGK73_38160 [Polyangiaceae bacterium]